MSGGRPGAARAWRWHLAGWGLLAGMLVAGVVLTIAGHTLGPGLAGAAVGTALGQGLRTLSPRRRARRDPDRASWER